MFLQYLVKCPEKPQPTSNPLIVEVQLNPPHYKLVMGPDEYELPKVCFIFIILTIDAASFISVYHHSFCLPGSKQHVAYSDTFLLAS